MKEKKLRYLVTLDAKTGRMLKAEQLGEAGDLAEVDLEGFARSIASSLRVHHGGLGTPPPVVINVYSGGAQGGTPEALSSQKGPPPPPPGTAGWDAPPPPPRPKPPNKPGK